MTHKLPLNIEVVFGKLYVLPWYKMAAVDLVGYMKTVHHVHTYSSLSKCVLLSREI